MLPGNAIPFRHLRFRYPPWKPLLAALLLWTAPASNRADTLFDLTQSARAAVFDLAQSAPAAPVTNLAGLTVRPLPVKAGQALVLSWPQPRSIHSVDLAFDGPAPPPADFRVEWWRRIWPDQGEGGWMKLDDPFNGEWTTAHCTFGTNADGLQVGLKPLEQAEAPGLQHSGFAYRQTYHLRLSAGRPFHLKGLQVHSDATVRPARLRFEWNLPKGSVLQGQPTFAVRNGRLLGVSRPDANAALLDLEYADTPNRLSPDRGHVLFRADETNRFAVCVDDVLREGGLHVRDIGVFVSDASRNLVFRSWPGPTNAWAEGTVTEQVARLPEQSFAQVRTAIPPKPPTHLFLGVPDLRQEIALGPKGEIELRADSLRSPGPDAALRPWTWENLLYQFASGEHPTMGDANPRQVERRLEDGWLPSISFHWTEDGIAWSQACVAVPLSADLATHPSRTGTETVALSTRFELRNTASEPRTAWLWLELNHPQPWRLGLDGMLVLAHPTDGVERPGRVPVRGHFDTKGKGRLDLAVLEPGGPGSWNPLLKDRSTPRDALRYRVELAPGESHAVEFKCAYIELLDAVELAALRQLSYPVSHDRVVSYWRQRLAQGMNLDVPDEYLNQLFKANLWHVLISSDLDPVTGQHQHGAATHGYPNFLNETMMVARSLDFRGEHQAAQDLLEPFLLNQGVKGLPGNFRSQQGVLYAAHPTEPDPYTAQGYNMHHGWGMWGAAEHYFLTRDAAFVRRYAPQLVRAADWIVRERQATRFLDPDGARPLEFGLAPAGDLEDVEEYLYFYATDAYYHLGLKSVAAALAAVATPKGAAPKPGTPEATLLTEARRIAHDADAFGEDIRRSIREAAATAPVVRLRDGTYIPWVPHRAHAWTHRSEGWIREALYPALHLVNGEVLAPGDRLVDWMIQDLEDNIFMSAESGYGLANPRRDFFSQGGFTLQPNLLDLALVYLQRDQVPNALRAFYNSAWASLYPDAVCFAEWVPAFGQGGGPLYKTPDECKFVQWLRHLLVTERDGGLDLGLGVPRAWMKDGQRVKLERAVTHFGKVDLELRSQAAGGRISATIRLTPTEPPRHLRLRLRHPAGLPLKSVRVNGHRAAIDSPRQLIELPLKTHFWQVEATF